ncbi:hypothetical protein [Rickettsia australis]
MVKTEMDNLTVEEQKIMDALLAKGEAIGKAREKVTMAKKILAKNRPLDEIMEFTDLTEEEIKKLK